MKNKLDVPPELAHLLEKREGADRREQSTAAAADNSRPASTEGAEPSRPKKDRRRAERRKS